MLNQLCHPSATPYPRPCLHFLLDLWRKEKRVRERSEKVRERLSYGECAKLQAFFPALPQGPLPCSLLGGRRWSVLEVQTQVGHEGYRSACVYNVCHMFSVLLPMSVCF